MLGTSYTIVYTNYAGHKIGNSLYNIARVLALYKSYWAAMNKIFIYARQITNYVLIINKVAKATF